MTDVGSNVVCLRSTKVAGTTTDGKRVEVNGCDVFTFRNGKIAAKSSYFKNRTA